MVVVVVVSGVVAEEDSWRLWEFEGRVWAEVAVGFFVAALRRGIARMNEVNFQDR